MNNAMMIDHPALEITGLSHRFGARLALDQVSLRVARGEFTALLGPNGAGKTTLFSIITRLYTNRSGQVSVFGHNLLAEPSAALAEIGVVFQTRTLDLDLTVRQNLAYHASLHGMGGVKARERIEYLLIRTGLSGRAKDKVRTLSGGQSRRIEIARSLIHAPRLLLLDEATVGLDLASRADIVRIVRGLVREEGLSVLWATHIFDEVDESDSVYVLHNGKIISQGSASDIADKSGSASLAEAFRALTEDANQEGRR
jgi:ABC-2 type transport system ATP-binding protein